MLLTSLHLLLLLACLYPVLACLDISRGMPVIGFLITLRSLLTTTVHGDLVFTYSVVPQGGAVALMMLRSDIKLGAIVGERDGMGSHCAGCRQPQTGHGRAGSMGLVRVIAAAAVPTGSPVAPQPPVAIIRASARALCSRAVLDPAAPAIECGVIAQAPLRRCCLLALANTQSA